jgi:hypothetical protein
MSQDSVTTVLYLICCEINRAARLAANRTGVSLRDWLGYQAELRRAKAEVEALRVAPGSEHGRRFRAADWTGAPFSGGLACEAESQHVKAEAGGDPVEPAKEEPCPSY